MPNLLFGWCFAVPSVVNIVIYSISGQTINFFWLQARHKHVKKDQHAFHFPSICPQIGNYIWSRKTLLIIVLDAG